MPIREGKLSTNLYQDHFKIRRTADKCTIGRESSKTTPHEPPIVLENWKGVSHGQILSLITKFQ